VKVFEKKSGAIFLPENTSPHFAGIQNLKKYFSVKSLGIFGLGVFNIIIPNFIVKVRD
jgi:hypothetical protein